MTKFSYTVYQPSGEMQRGLVEWPEEPGYTKIAALIEPIVGGPIEHVTVLHNSKRADMFVDEMGHMRTGGPKPLNEAATRIYYAASRARGDEPGDHYIAGPAVLFDEEVWR